MELEQLERFSHGCLFLYEALKCPDDFAAHVIGILLHSERFVHPDGLEVSAKAAVVVAGDCDLLALEDVRIALAVG